ncbi:hypothetical protein SAMIE_1016520 [Sphingobium amiense]|uniref:Uncharacterized protein n=1 Tax=Sphingobium amiense TaxID=135719 RepID=A0A494W1S3_9SPHN|nr:hypothetical protein [Sphingobium amiense]BBD98151.1 hypothetical protein SAMIE_1016520 [Sphingobium amiense]
MTAAPGRPLRFFGVVLAAWVAMRLASHGGIPADPPAPPPVASVASIAPRLPTVGPLSPVSVTAHAPATALRPSPRLAPIVARSFAGDGGPLDFTHGSQSFAGRHHGGLSERLADFAPGAGIAAVPLAPPPDPQARTPGRWRGSAWMLWRPDGGAGEGAVPAGRLGGSQAGVRIDYDLTPATTSRLAAYARLSSALRQPAAPEAALGLTFQPSRTLPVSLAVERRAALGDGGRNAIAAMIVGGFGPTPILPGVEATGYAQAGIVGLRRKDAFIDGKASLAAPIGGTPLRLGGAVSGGAQPGVSRLDIGPEASLPLPLPGIPTRLSFEWRQRIAGDARPRSGLALTLGADF